MRFIICDVCGNSQVPTNTALRVDNIVHCEKCLRAKFPNDSDLTGKTVVKEFDPTVCANCGTDAGDMTLKQIGSYPMCDACRQGIEARIFPTWVKVFFGAVLVLVCFSIAWNWRFVHAYYQIKEIPSVMEAGVVADVAALYADISKSVPEIHEFSQLSSYYRGMHHLRDNKSEEALAALRECADLPDTYGVPVLLLQAEIGALYDRKDYAGFLNASRRYLAFDTSAIAVAQVASAYACLYASEKSDSSRIRALNYLQQALLAQDTSRFFTNYVNRIEYRLATGEIIDKNTFEARFPNGWRK